MNQEQRIAADELMLGALESRTKRRSGSVI
jgi:hypothetical protein